MSDSKHILYIHQHFAVPSGSTATRSYEFSRRWVEAGHKVTVITGCADTAGLGPQEKLIQKRTIDGIDVIVVGISYSNKHGFLRRILAFMCFVMFSICVGLRVRKVDIMYVTSTPLTVGLTAKVVRFFRRIPYVFEIRDQWPEVPIQLGLIKNRLLKWMLLRLEKGIYRTASSVVALSPGMADGVHEVIGDHKQVYVIPNGCDTSIFSPDVDGSAARKERGWADKLVLLHAGAMGMANGLDFVVDAAQRLVQRDDIHFVLIGKGGKRQQLIQMVEERRLENIEILPSMEKTALAELFAAADVGLAIFANYPILEDNSANKFFDSISSGKAVLLNYGGWQRPLLEQYEAGFGCKLCDLDEFVEKVLYFADHRDEIPAMGANARRLALDMFDRDKLACEALKAVVAAAGTAENKK